MRPTLRATASRLYANVWYTYLSGHCFCACRSCTSVDAPASSHLLLLLKLLLLLLLLFLQERALLRRFVGAKKRLTE